MKTNRQKTAESLIISSFRDQDKPWKIVGRDLIVARACGCIRKLGKSRGKGALDSPSNIKLANIVANSFCEKHGDEFLLSSAGQDKEWNAL